MPRALRLKIDLHVHTTNSSDAFTKPWDLVHLCHKAGIDGVAITDHNRVMERLPTEIVALSGTEVSSAAGHVIGYGVRDLIQKGLSAEDTMAAIRAQGGVASLPHPYDILRAGVRPESLSILPDAIEVINSTSILSRRVWPPADRFASSKKLPKLGGSDSHIPDTLGRAFTIIEADSDDQDSILEAIRLGRTTPVGKQISLGMRLKKSFLQTMRSI